MTGIFTHQAFEQHFTEQFIVVHFVTEVPVPVEALPLGQEMGTFVT